MKGLLFTILGIVLLFIGTKSYSQCTVNAGVDQYIQCQATVQLNAEVPNWGDKNSSITANISAIRFVGDTLIAVGTDCIYRSTNFGASWSAISAYYNDNRSLSKSSQNHLFAAGYNSSGNYGRIMRSVDNGISWSLVVDQGSREYWDITVFDDTVYATGVNRSNWTGRLDVSNNGSVFGQVTSFSTTAWVTPYSIAVSPSTIVVGTGNGLNGGFKVSTNRGLTWASIDTTINGGSFPNVNDIQFVNNLVAFAVCHNGTILKTTDAGLTWTSVFSSGSSNSLRSVAFKDINNGFAVGVSGSIFKTIDGGINWTDVSTGTSTITSAIIKNNLAYLVTGSFHLLNEKSYTFLWSNGSTLSSSSIQNPIATVNQTITYTVSVTDENSCTSFDDIVITVNPIEMEVYNDQNILSGESVQLYVDADTNSNQIVSFQWTPNTNISDSTSISPIVSPTQSTVYHLNAVINGVNCASDSVIITVVEPTVFAGVDKSIQYGGSISFYDSSFEPFMIKKTPFSNTAFSMIKFFNSKLGYLTKINEDKLYKTFDGEGYRLILKTMDDISSMFFADSLRGSVGTEVGYFYYTIDGGQTWDSSYALSSAIRDIFYTSNSIFIIGDGGEMKKSINGGDSWTSISVGTSDDLIKVHFIDNLTGFVGIYNSTGSYIKKTTNGGSSWTTQGGSFGYIDDMYFLDGNIGFVTDYNNAKRTSDGGVTWSQIVVDGGYPTSAIFRTIDFINDSVGFMGSPFIKTTDKGITWTQIKSQIAPVYSISAVDEHIIMGAGLYDYIKYLDPVYNWNPDTYLDNENILHPIFTPGKSTNYALNVNFGSGHTATDSLFVTVPDPCISQLSYTVNSTNNSVAFTTLLNQAPYTSSFTYNWQFGDGTQSTQPNPVHTYYGPGYQNVNFTATSFNGCSIDTNFVVEIGNAAAIDCQADFAYSIDHSTKSIIVNSFSLGNNLTDYIYYFDDGQYAYNANSTHTYSTAGNYNVCLTVYSSSTGCSNTKCKQFVVDTAGYKCQSHFVYTVDSASKQVTFYNTSKNNAQNDWDFGDNGISTLENPNHIYSADGHYLTRLIVQNSGCKDMYQEIVNVNTSSASLYSGFGYLLDNNYGKAGSFPVKFFAASAGVPAKYVWDFGDGTKDSLSNQPMHDYANSGQYNVCLTVSDPVAGLTYNVCRNLVISGINSFENDALFKIFPNPTSNEFLLKLDSYVGSSFEIQILNNVGEEIFNTILHEDELLVNTSTFEAGIYFVKLQNRNQTSVRKLLIIR
jgi:PKD repeat protein/photosystem II stability/assembly factor-like uncharacterized protein